MTSDSDMTPYERPRRFTLDQKAAFKDRVHAAGSPAEARAVIADARQQSPDDVFLIELGELFGLLWRSQENAARLRESEPPA